MSTKNEHHAGTDTIEIENVWKQQMVGAAKVTWGKLTHDELLQTEVHVQKLAGLAQINGFFDQHRS